DGKVIMSFGVMGGQYQAVGHARFLTNMFDYEMDIQQALDFPRCFYDEGLSLLEKGFPSDIRQKLANIGHQVAIPQDPLGGGQGIHIDHQRGVLIGGSDPRKDGCALGY
ncbi:MAG: gamma-glutamyltransferase, partial [Rhodobacteraceae bacterium]|nr:gamma-glutamyltransferase [Paracoccaceae bacterium]